MAQVNLATNTKKEEEGYGSVRALDPKTGEIKEYPVKTPASGPHGLEFDKDGYLWFTANTKGYIGKLDPKTGDITEYKLPPEVRDPHTPLFAPNNCSKMIWCCFFSIYDMTLKNRPMFKAK